MRNSIKKIQQAQKAKEQTNRYMRYKHILATTAIAALAIVMNSCEGAVTVRKENSKTEDNLPEHARTFVTDYFEEIDVDTFTTDENGLKLNLANGTTISFDNTDRWKTIDPAKKTELPEKLLKNELPTKLLTHLKSNNEGQPIRKIERKKRGYVVTLGKPSTTLYFHRNGQLSQTPDRLPSNATVMLKKYFVDDSIASTILDDEQIYEIDMKSGIEIDFDRTGRFERIYANHSTLPEAFVNEYLPRMMTKYLKEKHPDRAIKKVFRKNYGYCVKLGKGQDGESGIELRFSKNGDYQRSANQNETEENDNL